METEIDTNSTDISIVPGPEYGHYGRNEES